MSTNNEPLLITEPSVHVIGWSEIDPVNYLNWAESIGMDPLLDDEETPVSRMLDRISQSESGFDDIATLPEFAGRFCYESFAKGRDHDAYIENVLDGGHGSVLEHANVTFALGGISRSLSHELVRHRAGTAMSQLSQRFVADKLIDGKNRPGFVVPAMVADAVKESAELRDRYITLAEEQLEQFRRERDFLEKYTIENMPGLSKTMMKKRVNEAAREFLPNWVETKMVMTFNVRALRHVLVLRGGEAADLQISRLAQTMLSEVQKQGDASVLRDLVTTAEGIQVKYPKV